MNKPLSSEEFTESCLVGGLVHRPEFFPDCAAIVKATDFFIPQARECWLEMLDNFKTGTLDVGKIYVSLKNERARVWFNNAFSDVIPMGMVRNAKIVAESSKKRRILSKLKSITEKATQQDTETDWILEDIISAYKGETGEVDRDSAIASVIGRFKNVQAENEKKGFVGMSTGFDLLSRDFVVYQPGHLWVVGAWTSVGKSAYMIEAVNRFFAANEQGRVAIFSTEMTEEQNIARMLANRSGINASVILSGKYVNDSHQTRVEDQEAWISSRKLHVYDKLRNIDDIMAQCRKLKYSGGVDLVWIDFIQNVFRPGNGESQYAMVSQIAKDLQALAHDLRCTVICLSQLPNHAGREDTGILEFKGAGEIAAACDIGVLMKREKKDKELILFDVRKNRHGKCNKYIFKFDNGWTRILEVEVWNDCNEKSA